MSRCRRAPRYATLPTRARLGLKSLRRTPISVLSEALVFRTGPSQYADVQFAADGFGSAASRKRLDLFISNLPNHERSLVTHHFIYGESLAAIGRSEKVSRMAICKRLKRILAKGRAVLAPYYD
jgi:DNA-directed RNA polymerase specialized sigma24 family protein